MSRELGRWVVVSMLFVTACSYNPPDNDPTPTDGAELPTVFFKDPVSLADENVNLLKIPVKLSEPSTSSVDFKVTGGVATPTSDFTFLNGSASGTLTFAGDQQDIEVMFSMDNMEEPDETIEITLENPVGATLGPQITHVITISADILPRVKFTTTATNRDEDTAGAKLDLQLDLPPKAPVTIDITLAGSATAAADYGLTAQTVTFQMDQQTAQLDYAVAIDDRDELDEIIAVDLANPIGVVIDTSAAHTEHTIKDDDATPTVSFADNANAQGESSGAADQIVELSAASNLVVTVNYSVTGGTAAANDVTVTGSLLTFQPGVTQQTIPINIETDNRDETANETVQITLATPVFANLANPQVHTLTIQDDDNPPTISFGTPTTSATEGGPKVAIPVTLTGETDLNVTVDFARGGASTAVNPGDFTFDNTTGTLSFAPGVTTQDIVVSLADDDVGELDETLAIVLSGFTNSGPGAITTNTVTIADDDCLGTGNFRVCLSALPAGALSISGAFDTDSNVNCAAQQPTGWTTTFGQPASCFVVADTITIPNTNGGIQVTGSRPLVLVAGTSITVVGVIDASANGTTDGPGGPSSLCQSPAAAAESTSNGGGGGAGGSFMTKGGNGGNGNNNDANATGSTAPNADNADPVILRGGCRGAIGGTGPGAAGSGGGAGGAVYLVAPTITIGNKIDVSGSGGIGGAFDAGGGGGGGSGGSIFLDATTTLAFTGTLMSNGGGAGQGADDNTSGDNGADPVTFNVSAAGGSAGSAGGNGGRGHRTGAAVQNGANGAANKGAGGGGGAGGFIKSTKSLAGGSVSAGKILP